MPQSPTAIQAGSSIGTALVNTIATATTSSLLAATSQSTDATLALVRGYNTAIATAAATLATSAAVLLLMTRRSALSRGRRLH